MLSHDQMPILVAALATIAVLGLLVAVFYSSLEKNAQGQKRLAAISASGGASGRHARSDDTRRRDIERTLREIEEKQKATKGSKPNLLMRMRQAGLAWSTRAYYFCCILVGLGTFLIVFSASRIGLLPSLGFGVTAGLLGPHFFVGFMRASRFKRFSKEFPNAVDVIVRGVRSGLPVVDCLRIISVEAAEPVRSEFKEIVDDQTLGLPIDQAIQDLPTRIPLAEAKFFAIVISLQSRTGGNLSDALSGLSKVLRERQKLQAKVRSMSAEAKTSAGIIGSMPVGILLLMQLTSPAYIEPMFTTLAGKVILAACGAWMMIGVLAMWKMIRFDF